MSNAGSGEENCVECLQRSLEKFAGPIAKFVVLKQIKDMGESFEDFPPTKLDELICQCVKKSIYDSSLQNEARNTLKEELARFLT